MSIDCVQAFPGFGTGSLSPAALWAIQCVSAPQQVHSHEDHAYATVSQNLTSSNIWLSILSA